MSRQTDLRRVLRSLRRDIAAADRASSDRRVAESLDQLPELAGPGELGTYAPTDGELDPNAGLDRLRSRGWAPHLPVLGDGAAMAFAEWHVDGDLSPNRFGIVEPNAPAELRPAMSLDVVFVPCVAVDLSGNRLGFGAGYYDRALADRAVGSQMDRPLLIGVVYDLQVVDTLEPEPWDVPLDIIVTDRRVVRRAEATGI